VPYATSVMLRGYKVEKLRRTLSRMWTEIKVR